MVEISPSGADKSLCYSLFWKNDPRIQQEQTTPVSFFVQKLKNKDESKFFKSAGFNGLGLENIKLVFENWKLWLNKSLAVKNWVGRIEAKCRILQASKTKHWKFFCEWSMIMLNYLSEGGGGY